MNYIYDIITNFFDNYIDFFEWEKNDKFLHFKQLPIIKVSKKDYKIIFSNKIKIKKDTLKIIKNKAILNHNQNNNHYYYLLITNGKDILGLSFDKNGINRKRSSIFVDEELDIIKNIKNNEYKKFKYIKINKLIVTFTTRKENNNKNYIINQLNNLLIKKNINKIEYLYYECFNQKEKDLKKAINLLIKNINNYYIYSFLNNFFK